MPNSIDSILIGYDLMGYVDGFYISLSAKTISNDGKETLNPAYSKWIRQDQMLFNEIIASVSKSVISLIASSTTSQEPWHKLGHLLQIAPDLEQCISRTNCLLISLMMAN